MCSYFASAVITSFLFICKCCFLSSLLIWDLYSLFAIGASLVILSPIAQSFTSNLSSNSDTCTLLFNWINSITHCSKSMGCMVIVVFLRCFRDPIWVLRIEKPVSRISQNYHRVPRLREIESLQVHTGYLTFSLKKLVILCNLSAEANIASCAVAVLAAAINYCDYVFRAYKLYS